MNHNKAPDPYPTARGVEAAIKAAAQRATASDPSLDVNKRIQLEYFNRFLSRVFSEDGASDWVLKGGMGLLARVPSTRSTRDIDLYLQGLSLEKALADLRRLASTNLGDHFRFEYAGHEPTIAAEAQPYTDGCRVTFNVFIGVAKKGKVQIDLAVGVGMTGTVQTSYPSTRLDLPRLTSHRYRLFPVVDQIADKVCATMSDYEGRPSTREKDLVDLVVFAMTQDVDGTALERAISAECGLRGMELSERFVVPPNWGNGYAKLSKPVPYCADYRTVDAAMMLMRAFLDPVLRGEARGMEWSPESRSWE